VVQLDASAEGVRASADGDTHPAASTALATANAAIAKLQAELDENARTFKSSGEAAKLLEQVREAC
jgi:hypothetical protein